MRLLGRLKSGNLANVRFSDVSRLLDALGFRLIRISGSHHIFHHPEVPEAINIQGVRDEVKPYQLRQLLKLVRRYNLGLEDE